MSKVRVKDAATEAMNFGLQRWGTVLRVGWFPYLLVLVTMIMAYGFVLQPYFSEIAANPEGADVIINNALNTPPGIVAQVVVGIFNVILLACVMNVLYRFVATGEEPPAGLAFFRLGPAEWRMTLAFLAYYIVMIVAGFAVSAPFLLIDGVFGVDEGPVATVLAFGLLGAVCFILWVGVRLIIFTPATAVEERLVLLRAWRLSEGHFWGFLGALLLVMLIFLVGYLILVVTAGLIITVGGVITAVAGGAVGGLFIAACLLVAAPVAVSVLGGVGIALPAVLYRQLTE